jgi:hypothetical protein
MALELDGKAKIKIPETAKPGDEIEVSTKFTAEQGPVDRIVTERLERAQKEDKAKITELENKLKGTATDSEKATQLQAQINELTAKNQAAENQARIEKALRKADASNLEDEFRAGITVDAKDDDGQVEEKIKAAIKKRDEFLKKHGIKKSAAGNDQIIGRVGSGGSTDDDPADKVHADLVDLMEKNNPGLKLYVDRAGDKAAQTKLLQNYKAQGLLNPKAKK